MMSASLDRSNELVVLMELRLAFGPGTRLWANRSREELCYDWLSFKSRSDAADFHDFALALLARERLFGFDPANVCEIRRRVAAVMRAYRVRKWARRGGRYGAAR